MNLIATVIIVFLVMTVDVFTTKTENKQLMEYEISDLADIQFPFHVYMTPELYESCYEAWRNSYHYKGIYAILKSPPTENNNTDGFGSSQKWMWTVCNNTVTRPSTVILQRLHGTERFNRSMEDYVNGFGSVKTDYWLGLATMHRLTISGRKTLIVTMRDIYNNEKRMTYVNFTIGPGPEYRLVLGQEGVGDLPDDLWYHVGQPFRAPGNNDRRRDGSSCVEMLNTGWWFMENEHCAYTLLTGVLSRNNEKSSMCHYRQPYPFCDSVYWMDWTGFQPMKNVFVEIF